MVDAFREATSDAARSFTRFVEHYNVWNNAFKDVSKLKETPISGDEVARLKRG